jgi:signal transduction histidine kinase/CheY-like chemotaxis protein
VAQETAEALEDLKKENLALREGRLELVRELNRIIALGDFALRCATAEEPGEVLDRALDVMASVLQVDMRVGFGLGDTFVDFRVFARQRSTRASSPPVEVPRAVVEYLRGVPVATIHRVGESNAAPPLEPLLDVLFPGTTFNTAAGWSGATVLILPLRPRRGETLGAILACKLSDASGNAAGPREDDATFLVLLSNHIDRALQSALLVSDLKNRGEELAESTRRFRESLENLERAQQQLLQARKLEAIGRLAGGVAHDFNNLLTVIKNHVEFLREKLLPGTEDLEDVQAIGEAAERATRITRQLLAFGRRNEGIPEVLDLNRIATELTRGIGRLVGEHVTIELALEPGVARVRADRGQLEQVLLNLLVNARDAMPDGGKVTLCTRKVSPDDLRETDLPRTPNQYVALVVSDTGCGMDEATRARLFEPFFTTKEPGQGTGLGLATVYGIVEKHGGHITVTSKPGDGTTFVILLPTSHNSSSTIEAVRAPEDSPKAAETGTILLVEDDAGLRRAALRTLTSKGYKVVEARDGIEALALFAEHEGVIDLIVTDVVMPRMTGPKLIAELRARGINVKAIYCSGYTFDMLDPRALDDGSFLSKPFSPEDLLNAVRAALAG